MSNYPQTPPATVAASTVVVTARPLSWGAILAGSFAALGTHLLITLLGLGIGFQTLQPFSGDNSAAEFSASAGISWTISALISLWIGGWVAGRFADPADRKIGRLHGFLVWSLATVVAFSGVALAAGALAGGAAKLVGGTAKAAGQAVSVAAPAAGDAFQTFTQGNGGIVASFIDEAVPAQNGQNGANVARARREIGWALYRVFSEEGGVRSPENRATLAQTLAQTTGRSQADAERIVNDWVGSYDRAREELSKAKANAERKAKEAADKAADVATKSAIWTFVAFLFGAAAAIWGGHVGAARWWNATYPEVSRHPFPQT